MVRVGKATIPAILAIALGLSACAYHRVAPPTPSAADQNYWPVSSTAVGFGAIEEQSIVEQCRAANSFAEVRVKTSLGQALATVLTLGFVQPARIEVRCAAVPVEEGKIPD
jgi:hypothetical protein